MSEQLEMWEGEESSLSLKEMDEALCSLRALQEEYSRINKLAKEASARYREQQAVVINMMETAKKGTYITEGIGRATLKDKLSVKVPKSPEEKSAFFNWVKVNMGQDAHDTYMTVNSASLNRLYKELSEEWANKGEVLEIDGLEAPSSYKELSFTKA